MKNYVKVMVVGAVLLMAGIGNVVYGKEPVWSFDERIPVESQTGEQTVRMKWTPDNLEIRDLNTGKDNVVSGRYSIGFVDHYVFDGNDFSDIVGFADQSMFGYEGYNGHMLGRYYSGIGNRERPDDVWIIHDQNGDGRGFVVWGFWFLGPDDILYTSADIEFDGVIGDVSKLPIYVSSSPNPAILPHMVIVPFLRFPSNGVFEVPANESVFLEWVGEPGSFYNVYFGTDPRDLELVSSMGTDVSLDVGDFVDWNGEYYWKVDKFNSSGGFVRASEIRYFKTDDFKCQEDLPGDFNNDCVVDLADFVVFASCWLKSTPMIPKH